MLPLPTEGEGPEAAEPSHAEIDAAIADDPDWAELGPIDWTKAEVVAPRKIDQGRG